MKKIINRQVKEAIKEVISEVKKARLDCKTCGGWNKRLDKIIKKYEKVKT